MNNILDKIAAGKELSRQDALDILTDESLSLQGLLDAAYAIRKKTFGNKVKIHIINNVQNGLCGEDCAYCAQSKSSQAEIAQYPMKTDEEILREAEEAYNKGAFRHCLVFSGKGPGEKRIRHLAELVKEMKRKFPMEICVSPGSITEEMAKVLKSAGLDRINHNLNTSRNHYANICSSHSYEDRVNTLKAAKKHNLQICSGVIIGMEETYEDVIEMAETYRDFQVESLPVNFFIPIEGLRVKDTQKLTPEYCLRVLCLFRFLNPKTEIRVAAGRELHLKDKQGLAFYPANSLFLDGYLNVKGAGRLKTLQMLKSHGFETDGDKRLDDLIKREKSLNSADVDDRIDTLEMKKTEELRPKAEN